MPKRGTAMVSAQPEDLGTTKPLSDRANKNLLTRSRTSKRWSGTMPFDEPIYIYEFNLT